MPYWSLTTNRSVVSRTPVSRVTNLEAQTNKNKARITMLDKTIQERLNYKACVVVEGGKGEPNDWSEQPFERYLDFKEKI